MATIDYYFSLMSPFTYLAGMELEQIAGRHGARIHYKPMDITEVFPQTGGVPLPKRHWSRQEYRLQELRRLSAAKGLDINLKPAHFPVDVTFASLAVIAAARAGKPVGEFVHSLLRAVWCEERDISDRATVEAIAGQCGIDMADLESKLTESEETFRANTREAIERGVFGSPFYIVDDERFWGQDRLEWVERYLSAQGGND
jgi:2-hydroxychromene-2-carboxylate isomerase